MAGAASTVMVMLKRIREQTDAFAWNHNQVEQCDGQHFIDRRPHASTTDRSTIF